MKKIKFVPTPRHERRVKAMYEDGVSQKDIASSIGAPLDWVAGLVKGMNRIPLMSDAYLDKNRRYLKRRREGKNGDAA